MQPAYSIESFNQKFPILYAHLIFLTQNELERANIDATKSLAIGCDYEATIKLVYLDPDAIFMDFVQDKHSKLVNLVRMSARERNNRNKIYRDYLHRFDRAKMGENPFPGRKNVISAERPVLTEQLIRTVIEIQILRNRVNCKKKETVKLFIRDSSFWNKVRNIRFEVYKKDAPSWTDDDLIDDVERQFANEVCDESPVAVAESILADVYGTKGETIRKKLLPLVAQHIKELFPEIPNTEDFIQHALDRGVKEHIRRRQKKTGLLF